MQLVLTIIISVIHNAINVKCSSAYLGATFEKGFGSSPVGGLGEPDYPILFVRGELLTHLLSD